MAPARTAKNTSAADAVISSPVSLLWAHQLRREHSVLLTRIEDLVAIVNNISPAQISTLHSRVQFTESQVKEHKEQQEKKHRSIDEQISKLRDDLNTRTQVAKDDGTEVKTQLQTLGENLAAVEKRQQEDCNGRHTDLKQELEWQTKKLQGSVEALIARITAFEARPQDDLQETVNVVKDSMEITKEHMKALVECSALDHAESANLGKESFAPAYGDPVEDESNEEQDMLTLHVPKHPESAASVLGDIDLDEDSLSLPDLVGRNQDIIGESVAMVPTNATSGAAQSIDLGALKQGKFQVWSSYLQEGQAFVDALPKRKEVAVVEAFVNGIYDQDNKLEAECLLDRNGWTWVNVEDCVEHHIHEEMQTQAVRAHGKLQVHRHQKGVTCLTCHPQHESPGQDGDDPPSRFDNDLPEKPHRQDAGPTLAAQAPRPRRSQRIQVLEATQKIKEATVMPLMPKLASKQQLKQKTVEEIECTPAPNSEETVARASQRVKFPERPPTKLQKRKRVQKRTALAKKAKMAVPIPHPGTPGKDIRNSDAVVAEEEFSIGELNIKQKDPARTARVAKKKWVPKPIPKIPIVPSSSDEE